MTRTDSPTPAAPTATSRLGQRAAVRNQRRRWSRAVDRWDHHGVVGLERVIDAVVAAAAEEGRVGSVVDIGAGTGAISLPMAAHAERVVAVDISAGMLDRLAERAAEAGITNVEGRVSPVEDLSFEQGSVDLVVSNYALHHLLDRDKARFVEQAAGWLRPGGRIVIGDMMLGRGASSEDRAILAAKARVMLRRGPGGWWRIAKNAWRLATRTQERPISMTAWADMLAGAGLVDVTARRVVAEAGIVTARRPPSGTGDAPGAGGATR